MTTPEEKDAAECEQYDWERNGGLCIHGYGPDCMQCWEDAQEMLHPGWNARLAAHMAAVVTRAKQGTIALGIGLCILPMHAYADAYPLVPTDGECAIVRTYEDGGATALCGTDEWAYDADGGFIYEHGIKYFYRDPGTWYQVS